MGITFYSSGAKKFEGEWNFGHKCGKGISYYDKGMIKYDGS